jgi:peptide/nickel transport system substrate-binding protein
MNRHNGLDQARGVIDRRTFDRAEGGEPLPTDVSEESIRMANEDPLIRSGQADKPRGLSRRDFLRSSLGGAALLAGGATLANCGGSSSSSSTPPAATTSVSEETTPSASEGTPKRGGNLRVAMVGGTAADSLDADDALNFPQVMRNFALYNGLVALDQDAKGISLDLAEEMTPSDDAMSWTIRLRPDVTFHDGKPLSAEDVIFTLQRIMDPEAPHSGASALAPLDPNQMEIIDERTVRLGMLIPYATLVEQLSGNYYFGIVPVGYDPTNPIGTGPFKYKSFVPGQQSVFDRNPNYHKSDLPYLDELTIIDSFSDPTSAFNALTAGQVDIAENSPPVLADQVQGSTSLKALISDPGLWVPFTMLSDTPPFDDVNVRQAFRLIVDRQQMIDVAVNGLGAVANDVFGQYDPCYDTSLQREQNIDEAKSLLQSAGQANMTVELVTSQFTAGAVEAAQAFAEQAKAAGVTVNVREVSVTEFFTNYTQWPFAQDFLAYSPFMSMVAQTSLATSPFNTTHFSTPRWIELYDQANATIDQASRCELIGEMQQIYFDEGGYIIPSFNRQVDITANTVNGFGIAGTGIPLGNGNWENAWLA